MLVLATACAAAAFTLAAHAEDPARGADRSADAPQRKRPVARPALQACAGSAAGAECRFTGAGQREHTGVCEERPVGMVCLPQKVGPAMERKAGPAIAACTDLEVGAACSFEMRGGRTLEGTCQDRAGRRRCAIDRPNQPRRGGAPGNAGPMRKPRGAPTPDAKGAESDE